MKRILFLFIIMVCGLTGVSAQTYLEHLQTKEEGKGTVTLHQSKDIDILVNGTKTDVSPVQKPATIPAQKPTTAPTEKRTAPEKKTAEKKETDTEKQEVAKDTYDAPAVDTSKKVMRNAYKVTGFRVQVFAGGNSRADKSKAESISNQIKKEFPTEPVYCHFYSPRWICRMGNYRTYEEAKTILNKVHEMGFTQASIVKGKITVSY